ncbi:MAG: hypothetical protein H7A32_02045 [Deltaproteobacteria bacterium]|nr:hypothetical protein [Deltaproteobacteria bacterium]
MKKLIYTLIAGFFALGFASISQAQNTVCSTVTGGGNPSPLTVTLDATTQETITACVDSSVFTVNGATDLNAAYTVSQPTGYISGPAVPLVDFLDTGTDQRVIGDEFSVYVTSAHFPGTSSVTVDLYAGPSATTGRSYDIDFANATTVTTVAGLNALDVATPFNILTGGTINADICGNNYSGTCTSAGTASLDRALLALIERDDDTATPITAQAEIRVTVAP